MTDYSKVTQRPLAKRMAIWLLSVGWINRGAVAFLKAVPLPKHKRVDGKAVVKIDVEGFEWGVFEGASAFFERVQPPVICELFTSAPNARKIETWLDGLGWHRYLITDQGLVARDRIVPVKAHRDWLSTKLTADALMRAGVTMAHP